MKKPSKESTVQSSIQKWLKDNGWFTVKIIMASKNGVPDVMAIKDGRTVFIEVKREKGGVLSPIQEYRIKEMREYGAEVIIANSLDIVKQSLI